MSGIRCHYCFESFSMGDVKHRWCPACWPQPNPEAEAESLRTLHYALKKLQASVLQREPLLAHAERADPELRESLREIAGILDFDLTVNGSSDESRFPHLYATLRRALLRDVQAWGNERFDEFRWRYPSTNGAGQPGVCPADHPYEWNPCCPWCLEPVDQTYQERRLDVGEHLVGVVGASTSGKSALIAAMLRGLGRAAQHHGLDLGVRRDLRGGAGASAHEVDLYSRLQDLRRDQPAGWVWDPFLVFLSYPAGEASHRLLPLVYADVPGEAYSKELEDRLPSNQPAWLYIKHCRSLLFLVDLTTSERGRSGWSLALADDASLLQSIVGRLEASPERRPRHLILVVTKADQAMQRRGRAASQLRSHLRSRATRPRGLDLLRQARAEDRWTRGWLEEHFNSLHAIASQAVAGRAFSLYSAIVVSAFGRAAFESAVELDGSRKVERYVSEPVPRGIELPLLMLMAHEGLDVRWDRLLSAGS